MKTLFILILTLFTYAGIYAQTFSGTDNVIVNNHYSTGSNNSIKGFRLSHSDSQIIEPGKTVSCNNGSFHYENSYYLAYDLKNDFNLNGDWIVENVEIAVESAVAGNLSDQPLVVKLFVLSDYNHQNIIRDSLTLLKTDTVSVSDSESGTLKNIDFSPGYIVSDGKVLVVEFLLPDGQEDNNLLFLGSNNDRISDSTFIRAPHCGINEPVNVSEILFPDMMLIANIYGQYASPNPEIQSFTIEGQLVNTEIKNDPDYTVKVVMPADTVLNNLTPIIQIPAGFQITPASGENTDFSLGSVIYTVDNNFSKVSQSWDVSVVNAGPDIIGAGLPELNGEVVIDGSPDYTVTIPVLEGSNLNDLSPNIFVYNGFTITPESGSSQDFSLGSVTYTVSHETLPVTQDWQVSVIETPAGINKISKHKVQIFPNPANDIVTIKAKRISKIKLLDITGKTIFETSEQSVNLSAYKEGIYILKIYIDGIILNRKLLIIR
ncbi:MAG: hypothetical protein DRI94_07710 [Bacteroidetes bacterium]|nr:MAG: hypothetical protein DRI94_07710 [Bacteroidota bacterium]